MRARLTEFVKPGQGNPYKKMNIGLWANPDRHLNWLIKELKNAGFKIKKGNNFSINVFLSDEKYYNEAPITIEIRKKDYLVIGGSGYEYRTYIVYDFNDLKNKLILKLESSSGGLLSNRIKIIKNEIKKLESDYNDLIKLNDFKNKYES